MRLDNRRLKLSCKSTLTACSAFRKGIFDIKASSYVEYGIPFVRIGDGLIDTKDLAFISPAAHAAESKTALVYGGR